MKHLIKRIGIALSIVNELSDKEKLDNLTKEQKIENLIKDIQSIRRNGNYVPDYNKPKLYMDYLLMDNGKIITSATLVAQNRPQDFGNDVSAWFNAIREEGKKAEENKKLKALQQEQENEKALKVFNIHMNSFLRVN